MHARIVRIATGIARQIAQRRHLTWSQLRMPQKTAAAARQEYPASVEAKRIKGESDWVATATTNANGRPGANRGNAAGVRFKSSTASAVAPIAPSNATKSLYLVKLCPASSA